MITGYTAGARHAPHVRLEVLGTDGTRERIEFLVDTGFSEFVTLPRHLVTALSLEPLEVDRLIMADGTPVDVPVFEAVVAWDGDRYGVPVVELESTPLLGCAMMTDYRLEVNFASGGDVVLLRRTGMTE